MSHLLEVAKKLARREEGLETVEYALVAALLVVALVSALVTLGDAMSNGFGRVADIL